MTDTTSSSFTPNQAPGDQDLEHRYYQYLRSQHYASTDALLNVLRWYLPYFEGFTRVLDIGCGHGEFLQLLQENGHEAVGIDIDPAMVSACRASGLTAYEGDAIDWLGTEQTQFDAIFSSNVIEHMDASTVQRLIQQAHGALRPGGLLLIGTPNPESLIVQFHEFWRDPTHVRLYGRQLIEFFFADAGFRDIHNGNNAEAAWDGVDSFFSTAAERSAPPIEAMPPIEPIGPLHPLPQPPPAAAPLRHRLTFRLLNFVYQKFLEPYVALIRIDQERQQQQLQATHALVFRLHESTMRRQETLHTITEQLQQLGSSVRFMYPPRELFVYGTKAMAATESSAAQPEVIATETTADKPQE